MGGSAIIAMMIHRMSALVVLAMLAALSGCKSTGAFMEETPRKVLHASGAPKDVAFCIGKELGAPAREDGDGSKVIMVPTIYGGSGEAFTVRPDGQGSVIEYRRAKGLMGGLQKWKTCLN